MTAAFLLVKVLHRLTKRIAQSDVNPRALGKSSQRLKGAGKTNMAKTVDKARSAITGRFIPMKEAVKHPTTTVVEKVKVGPTKHHK